MRSGPTRRALLAGAAAGLTTSAARAVEPVARALVDQRAGRIPHLSAREVARGWGVCARPGADASAEATASMLGQLGTCDLRVPFVQYGQSAAARIEALARAMRQQGVREPPRVTALLTAYMNDLGTTWAMQQAALLAFAPSGMLRAIEGPNEIDNLFAGLGAHGPDDRTLQIEPRAIAANHLAWSRALGAFKRANPVLRGVTTIAPSLAVGPPANFRRLADVSGEVDAGNLHFYAGHGRQPSYSMRFDPYVGTFQNMLHWARASQVPHGPVWLTECGATTSGDYARSGISQAKYLANQLFNLFAGGGQALFVYQLFDGSGTPGDGEGNFGLFHRDHTPKPVVRVLSGLKHLLAVGHGRDDPANRADRPTPAPAHPTERLALTGFSDAGAADPSCAVLAKADGRTLIAVWNEPPIDDGHGHDVNPPAREVTLELGNEQRFAVHDLLDPELESGREARRAAARRGGRVELTLRGHPVLVELM